MLRCFVQFLFAVRLLSVCRAAVVVRCVVFLLSAALFPCRQRRFPLVACNIVSLSPAVRRACRRRLPVLTRRTVCRRIPLIPFPLSRSGRRGCLQPFIHPSGKTERMSSTFYPSFGKGAKGCLQPFLYPLWKAVADIRLQHAKLLQKSESERVKRQIILRADIQRVARHGISHARRRHFTRPKTAFHGATDVPRPDGSRPLPSPHACGGIRKRVPAGNGKRVHEMRGSVFRR